MTSPSNPQPESQSESFEIRNQLVAYLDGELDGDSSRRIEELLSTEPGVRRELKQLERTWDLLDRLPRAELDAGFASSTVEMVAISAAAEVEKQQAADPKRRLRTWLLGACGGLAAAVAGFVLASQVWPHPNEQLLVDLPILEELEAYRHAEDIDFLRKLQSEGLFAKEPDDGR